MLQVAKLLKHQIDGIEWILRHEASSDGRGDSAPSATWSQTPLRGGILADEAGLGKKYQMLTAMSKNPLPRTLIVVPYASLGPWTEQLRVTGLNTIVLNTEKAWNSLTTPPSEPTYYLINYQKMSRRVRLRHVEWDRIVFDDAFILQNTISRSYAAAKEMKAKISWLITSDLPSDLSSFFTLLKVEPDNDLILRRQLYRIVRGPPVPDIFKIDATFTDVGSKILNKFKESTVIYCKNLQSLLNVKSHFDEIGKRVYCVHREQELSVRKENLSNAEAEEAPLIVCTRGILPQLNLHTFKNIIFVDSSINEKHLERLIRRVVCIGQRSVVKVFLLSS
jgi:hypothetical protein